MNKPLHAAGNSTAEDCTKYEQLAENLRFEGRNSKVLRRIPQPRGLFIL